MADRLDLFRAAGCSGLGRDLTVGKQHYAQLGHPPAHHTLISVVALVAGAGGSGVDVPGLTPRPSIVTAPSLVPVEKILSRILVLRGLRVVLDRDLATLYGVSTRRLNEQVRRNPRKFPEDFMFRLTKDEKSEVVAKCDHLQALRFSPVLPSAFTEHGAIQAANIVNSATATEMSVHVVRAFVRLRQWLVNHKALAAKLAELDSRVGAHDEQIAALIAAIRQLTTPIISTHGRKIGYHRGNR